MPPSPQPGKSATVSGDLTLGPTSTFQFSIPTESTIVNGAFTSTGFDQLTVTGDVTLGNSALAVQVGAGFPISSHSTFTILTAGSALGGKFSNVSTGSRLTSLDGQGSFLVSLSGQTVQLSTLRRSRPRRNLPISPPAATSSPATTFSSAALSLEGLRARTLFCAPLDLRSLTRDYQSIGRPDARATRFRRRPRRFK